MRAKRGLNDACTRAQLKPIEGDEESGGNWQVMRSATDGWGCLFLCASLIFGRGWAGNL